jgi:HSP20 family protein
LLDLEGEVIGVNTAITSPSRVYAGISYAVPATMVNDETMDLSAWRWSEPVGRLAVDIAEDNGAYIVEASVPGMKPNDLDVSITDNILTIKGEVKQEQDISKEKYHLRERRYGSFARSIALPAPVDLESVEATYKDGVLTLNVPKTAEAHAKRIPIKTVETKVLEGETVEEK